MRGAESLPPEAAAPSHCLLGKLPCQALTFLLQGHLGCGLFWSQTCPFGLVTWWRPIWFYLHSWLTYILFHPWPSIVIPIWPLPDFTDPKPLPSIDFCMNEWAWQMSPCEKAHCLPVLSFVGLGRVLLLGFALVINTLSWWWSKELSCLDSDRWKSWVQESGPLPPQDEGQPTSSQQ